MKKVIFLVLILIPALSLSAVIDGKDIIRQIDRGEAVSYQNVEIEGDLDFTTVKNRVREKKFSLFGNETYWCHVEVSVRFEDCVFNGQVLGYFNDEDEDILYNAKFEKNVVFKNCDFGRGANFKYSVFQGQADFSKSVFARESVFKYTRFKARANFRKTIFKEEANFKYTKLPEGVDFQATEFRDEAVFKYTDFHREIQFQEVQFLREADFKYAKFPDGVSFKDARFRDDVNFKYAKFDDPVSFENTKFQGDVNMKYTKFNGRAFHREMLERW